MQSHQSANFQAIRDCIGLIQQYPLEDCLEAASKMCQALDNGNFIEFLREAKKDPCFSEVSMLAMAHWGARNVFSALLYLSGDTDGYQLQLAAYKYASEQATQELRDFLRRKESQ